MPRDVFRPGLTEAPCAVRDRRADTLLLAAVLQLKRHGLNVVSAMPYLRHLVPDRGTLTHREPDATTWQDIRFGLDMARRVAGLDIGQTVVIKGRAVVAVESLEGTDACIRRGGEVAGGGVTVVKVAKPRQDPRFDVPVIGLATMESLRAAGSVALAVEAGKTILLDRDTMITAANAAGLSIVAL